MKCSQLFEISGVWIICTNPAAVIAKTYKHGDKSGVCSFCMYRLKMEDDTNFFERHEFIDIDE